MARVGNKRQPLLAKNASQPTTVYRGNVAPCTTPEPVKLSYSIDLPTLERDLDRRIMADKSKGHVMSPKDLYVRSNPGLLGASQDLTNPREWYNSSTTKSLMTSFAAQDNGYGKRGAGAGGPQSTVAFLVNFPTSSAIGFGDTAQGDGGGDAHRHQPKHQHPLPHIRHKESCSGNTGSDPVPKQTIDYDGDEIEADDKENEPANAAGSAEEQNNRFPPIGNDVTDHEHEGHAGDRHKKANAFNLPRLAKQDIVIPKNDLHRNSRDKNQQWKHSTLPEEMLKQAQIRAGFARKVKNERKVLTTTNSREPGSFQTYTEKYMELRIPKAHKTDKSVHDNLHKTYQMRQKSVLKLKFAFDGDNKPPKRIFRQKTIYDNGSPNNADYSAVKSKLGDYINRGPAEKEGGKSIVPAHQASQQHRKAGQDRHFGPASHVSYRRPQFSLGPNAKPITPKEKYQADSFPFLMDDDAELERDHRQEPQTSQTKYLSNTSAHKITVLRREKTKAAVLNIALSNAPSTADVGDHEDHVPIPETPSVHEGSLMWHSELQGSMSQFGDRLVYHSLPVSASSKPGLIRQGTALMKFKKIEVFGERQSEANGGKWGKKTSGETIESVRGTQSLCPPYLIDTRPDTTDQAEAESHLSSQAPDHSARRVSTVTVGTDVSEAPTPRTTDSFPKPRGGPSSLASRQKNAAMAPLIEKSFISDHTRLGVVSTAHGTLGSEPLSNGSPGRPDVQIEQAQLGADHEMSRASKAGKEEASSDAPEVNNPSSTGHQKSDLQIVFPSGDGEEKKTSGSTVPTNSVSPNMFEMSKDMESSDKHNSSQRDTNELRGHGAAASPVPSEACKLQRAPSMSSAESDDGN